MMGAEGPFLTETPVSSVPQTVTEIPEARSCMVPWQHGKDEGNLGGGVGLFQGLEIVLM